METLKSRYQISWDQRKFGGTRRSISINRLPNYIPFDKAVRIIKSIKKCPAFPVKYSVQNKGVIVVYLK